MINEFDVDVTLFSDVELAELIEKYTRKVLNMELLSPEEFMFFTRLREEEVKRNGQAE